MRVAAADIQRAQSLLNWSPQVPLEAGIQNTLDWARTVVDLA
jgi:nucleoside-diphosphate-sugar epimerase